MNYVKEIDRIFNTNISGIDISELKIDIFKKSISIEVLPKFAFTSKEASIILEKFKGKITENELDKIKLKIKTNA